MKRKTQIVEETENVEVFVRTGRGNENTLKKPSKKKIIITLTLIIVVVTALGVVFSQRGSEVGPTVSTAPLTRMDLEQTVSIKGTIQGSESADVASTLNYKITAIYVHEGDIVKKDQVLATLDVSDLQEEYNKAALSRNESKRAYESAAILYEEGAMAKEEYLKLKAAYERDELTLSSFNIGEKKNIRSPIAGTVTRVNVNIGRYANDTENYQPMFVVENLQDLQMNVKISEYDISKIKVGQEATITAEVLGTKSVAGVVSKISPTGEAKDQTSSEKVIPVVIDVDKGDANLIAGVTAKATILIEKREMALTVPIDAIMEDPESGETSIFIVKEGVLKKVPVTVGLEGNLDVEILSEDVAEGDQVVLAPTFELEDGKPVSVNESL